MKPRAAALRIAFTAALLGSASLAHAELKGPVKTRQGLVSGAPSTRADGVMVYKGIPFAAAPVGALRFKDAQPPQPWQLLASTGKHPTQPSSLFVQNDARRWTAAHATTTHPHFLFSSPLLVFINNNSPDDCSVEASCGVSSISSCEKRSSRLRGTV